MDDKWPTSVDDWVRVGATAEDNYTVYARRNTDALRRALAGEPRKKELPDDSSIWGLGGIE